MKHESIVIKYPERIFQPENSEVNFYDDLPDLYDFFYNEKSENRRFFITDGNVASLDCMQKLIEVFNDDVYEDDCLLVLGSGEKYKNLDSVLTIVKMAMEHEFTVRDTFIGIGGGVICDLVAFAASIYKRGINLQLIPTTLLAMVDAAIGGKTGCDVDNLKNMIGTVYPASKIHIFSDFTQFTSDKQFKSGLAQVFKTAFVKDSELFDQIKNNSDLILSRDKALLQKMIKSCIKAKVQIMQEEAKKDSEKGCLHLGLTFASALETMIGLGILTNGEAVAWGISRAVTISWNKGYCSTAFKDEMLSLLNLYGWETGAIPALVTGGSFAERLIKIMHNDKKNLTEKIRLTLPKEVGQVVIEDVDDSEILKALK